MNELILSQDFTQNVVIYFDSFLVIEKDSKFETTLRALKVRHSQDFSQEKIEQRFNVWIVTSRSLESAKKLQGFKVFVKSDSPDFFESSLDQDSVDQFDLILEREEFDLKFFSLLDLWFRGFQDKQLSSLTRQSNVNLKNLLKDLRLSLKSEQETEEKPLTESFYKFLSLYEGFYLSTSFESLKINVEKAQKKLFKKNLLQLKTLFEIAPKEKTSFYYLGLYKGSHLFLESKEACVEGAQLISLFLMTSYLTRLLKTWNLKATEIKPAQILFEAFESLPLPVILTGVAGELLHYNAAFGKLNLPPSSVLKFENFDEIKNKDHYWTVKKGQYQSTRGERELTVFFPKSSKKNRSLNSGSQDLGIITSSIAHELNNPLAGILAALEVLMMEDYLDSDTLEELKEMKQSSLRCKQLVETFLGFSKVNLMQTEKSKELLIDCFEQALNLQRFRMVESQVRILLSVNVHHPYSYSLHQPTMTMLAYLVMGELMTHFNHLRLLEGKSAKGQSIEIDLREDADNFQLKIRPQLALNREFSSKLLTYLLEQEKLSLSYGNDGDISFTHKIMLI